MVDQIQHPSVVQKVVGRLLHSSLSKNIQGSDGAFQRPTLYQRRAAYGKYSNAALRYPKVGAATILSSTASTICIQAPAENDQGSFANDFCYGSFSAASVRLVVLPVASLEHLKLLLKNQDEMIMNGRLSEPFKSCYDFLNRKIKDEGFASLWKGKTANFIRCLTAQIIIVTCFCLSTYFSIKCKFPHSFDVAFIQILYRDLNFAFKD